jgi:hypothetical protein
MDAAYHREWRAKNQDKVKATQKRYFEKHDSPEFRAHRSRKTKAFQKTEKGKICKLRARLKSEYGITLERYDAMLITQKGVCAICGKANANGKRLSVDHDHKCCAGKKSCGKCVRGLLCEICNPALGLLNDSPELFLNSIRYLCGDNTEAILRAYLGRVRNDYTRNTPKE